MYYIYILYSHTKDRYYVGYTHDLELRLNRHNSICLHTGCQIQIDNQYVY